MSGPTRPRQAVVLIHGIGEQMPMTTTRGFVKEIRPEGDGWRVYSEADQADETFELHTYAVPPLNPDDPACCGRSAPAATLATSPGKWTTLAWQMQPGHCPRPVRPSTTT